jgi:salicylate hydroxylase
LTIGADGVWSKQLSRIAGAAPARFAGRLAWRSLLPFASAPGFLHRDQVTAFLGPRSHLVVYPLKDAGAFNLVAITDGSERSRNFGMPLEPDDRARLEKAFLHWNPAIRSLVLDQANPLCWPLFEMADGPWQNGQDLVLVGDAAHAMTPFAAQGACMAIEDSYILAHLLSTRPQAEAIREFETLRRPRIARVRRRAAFNRFAYHAQGPVRVVRDMILTHRSPESLSQDFDWLYGYDPD